MAPRPARYPLPAASRARGWIAAVLGLRMPLRFLRGSAARLALTVIALACGVALVCAIDLANRAVMRAFVEVMDSAAGRITLQVHAGEEAAFPEAVGGAVAAVPGVELATPVVTGTAFPAAGEEEPLRVLAFDVGDAAALRAYGVREQDGGREHDGVELDDPFYLFSQPDSLVLTRTFAARRGLTVGDGIDLVTPQGRRRFTVRGVLESPGLGRAEGPNLAVMDVFAAEIAFTRPGFVNRVDIVVERGRDPAEVASAIAATLPPGLRVDIPNQRRVDIEPVMQSLQVMLQAVGLLGLAAAFLIAFNRLATVSEARAWQLGVLRAVGLRGRVVWWQLVKESLVVGGAGVALGIPLGIGLGRLVMPVIATTAALTYRLVVPEAELAVTTSSLALAAGLGLAAALLAAALPAWRATRLALQATIRGRGTEQPGARMKSMWAVRAGVVGAMTLALALQSLTASATWGLCATALIPVGTCLAARPLLHLLRPLFLPVTRRFAGAIGRLVTTTILRNPRRTALTAATLGVGLGAILWLWTLAASLERSLVDALGGGVRADLVATASHSDSGYVSAPLSEKLLEELRCVPGVLEVAGQRVVDWHHVGGPIAIDALDPRFVLAAPPSVSAPLLDEVVARGEAVNVSANFALHLRARPGDSLTLETPSGPLTVRVAGITPEFLSPRGTVQMSRTLYKRYWHDDKVSLVYVRLAPDADPEGVRAAIARGLGREYRLRVLPWADFVEYCAAQVRRAFAGVDILAGLVLLVVLVGMADTFAAGVAERTPELGAIRAVGVRRRYLRRMVLVEGVVLGAMGLLLALASGLALGTLWVTATFPHLLGWVITLHVPYRHAAVLAAMTAAVSVAAALAPAHRAARLEPAVALRYE